MLSFSNRISAALRLSAAAGALAVALPALAQTAPATADQDVMVADTFRTDIVVTASGVPQAPETTGEAITVIDKATIEQRQTMVLSDLLATTPGVTVSRNGGIGGFTAVRIRGAEGEQTLTLIDGVRVNDPSSPGGGFDFANLLAGSVERVEILRGPNSVPWGSQAIGGVVNVITEKPQQGLSAHGGFEYGGYDSKFANAGVSGSSGIVSGSLTGGYLKTDGVSAYAGGTEPDGYRQYGATGRLEVAFTPNVRLDLRGYYADSHAELDGFPAPTFAFADDREYSTAQETYGYAGLHADLPGGRFRNVFAFTIADINRDNFDRDLGVAPQFFARGRSERYSWQGDFDATDTVRLIGGAEHEDDHFNDGSTFTSRGTTSFYGELLFRPVYQLSVTGGVRHDHDDAYGSHTTFGVNAAYTLPSDTTLRASYTEGFKAPTLYQLYADFYGTPTLKPESARSYDLGAEQKLLDGKLTASVTWFHRDTRNQIDFDLGTFTYGNIDRARAKGVELAATLRPVDGLMLQGEYSFLDSENRSPGANFGNDLQRRPHQTASLSADYRLPFGLSFGGTLLHVSHSYDNPGNSTRLDPYTLVGIRAEMPIAKKLSVYARVDNLFDKKYQTVANYGTLGRAAYGGIRVKFD